MWINISPLILLKYWIFQGALYMNRVELLHRFTLEVLFFLAALWLLQGIEGIWLWMSAAFIVAHTLNCILNGHLFAVFAHDVHWFSLYKDPDRFVAYIEGMQARLVRKAPAYIDDALIFGSIVRGVFRETSDLDIRYIAAPGLWHGLCAAHFVFIERLRALLAGYPIDVYMFLDDEETRRKMKTGSEPPISIYNRRGQTDPQAGGPGTLAGLKASIHTAVPEPKPPRVIVIGAGGGHLTEALLAMEGVPARRLIATFCLPHTHKSLPEDERITCLIDPHDNLFRYMINFLQSLWLVLRERPQAIVSTGGSLSIATSLLGKLIGAKLIYIESGARVTEPSRTGAFMYRFADLFIVQWEPLLKHFPKAVYGGMLF